MGGRARGRECRQRMGRVEKRDGSGEWREGREEPGEGREESGWVREGKPGGRGKQGVGGEERGGGKGKRNKQQTKKTNILKYILKKKEKWRTHPPETLTGAKIRESRPPG